MEPILGHSLRATFSCPSTFRHQTTRVDPIPLQSLAATARRLTPHAAKSTGFGFPGVSEVLNALLLLDPTPAHLIRLSTIDYPLLAGSYHLLAHINASTLHCSPDTVPEYQAHSEALQDYVLPTGVSRIPFHLASSSLDLGVVRLDPLRQATAVGANFILDSHITTISQSLVLLSGSVVQRIAPFSQSEWLYSPQPPTSY